MKDLNFFEPYVEKREFKFNKIYFLYGILLLSVIGSLGLGIYNQVKISMLEDQIADRKEVTENPKTVEKYNEVKELETELRTFSEELDGIIQLDEDIAAREIIGEELLYEISSRMPADLFLTSVTANGRDISMSGVAKDSYSVAEFSKGLGFMEDVGSVFVSNISSDDIYYNFSLKMNFKDVTIDEEQDTEQEFEEQTSDQ